MHDPSFAEHLAQLQEDEVSLPFALRCVDDLVGQLLARHLRGHQQVYQPGVPITLFTNLGYQPGVPITLLGGEGGSVAGTGGWGLAEGR